MWPESWAGVGSAWRMQGVLQITSAKQKSRPENAKSKDPTPNFLYFSLLLCENRSREEMRTETGGDFKMEKALLASR